MAVVYFDSSAFVKLMVEEDGSDVAAALWDGCDAAVSSALPIPKSERPWRPQVDPIVWTHKRKARQRSRSRSIGRRQGLWS